MAKHIVRIPATTSLYRRRCQQSNTTQPKAASRPSNTTKRAYMWSGSLRCRLLGFPSVDHVHDVLYRPEPCQRSLDRASNQNDAPPEKALGLTGRIETQCNGRAAIGPVLDGYLACVGIDDAGDDRKAKSGAAGPMAVATPESTKDQFTFLLGYARSAIQNTHQAIFPDPDLDSRSGTGMPYRILDDVADGPENGLRIASYPHRRLFSRKRDILVL